MPKELNATKLKWSEVISKSLIKKYEKHKKLDKYYRMMLR